MNAPLRERRGRAGCNMTQRRALVLRLGRLLLLPPPLGTRPWMSTMPACGVNARSGGNGKHGGHLRRPNG